MPDLKSTLLALVGATEGETEPNQTTGERLDRLETAVAGLVVTQSALTQLDEEYMKGVNSI